MKVEFCADSPSKLEGSLTKLLNKEKRRAGLKGKDLYYIGVADTARWWWCSKQSILHNRRMELAYFQAHLEDRIEYSIFGGYVDKEPSKFVEDIVDTLPDLSKIDIEKILAYRKAKLPIMREPTEKEIEAIALSRGETEAEIEGIKAHYTKAEKYATVRWGFKWRDFIINGVPDGITDEYVYEFKTVGSEFLLRYSKPVVFAQADLYGYFFRRSKKRVQILIKETGEIKTWVEPINTKEAELTLAYLWKALRKNEGLIDPVSWKCKSCRFKEECRKVFGKAPPGKKNSGRNMKERPRKRK